MNSPINPQQPLRISHHFHHPFKVRQQQRVPQSTFTHTTRPTEREAAFPQTGTVQLQVLIICHHFRSVQVRQKLVARADGMDSHSSAHRKRRRFQSPHNTDKASLSNRTDIYLSPHKSAGKRKPRMSLFLHLEWNV